MIEKVARRAGGFASTTALRWIGAGREALPEAVTPQNGSSKKLGGRASAAVVTGAVALLSSHKARSAVEHGLLAAARALRPDAPTARRNGSGASRNGHNGHNGNGNGSLSEKTRAELYELAKKMDLPGRSAMSKDQLAKALSK